MHDAPRDHAEHEAPLCRRCEALLLCGARHCTHCGETRRLGPAWDFEARARVVLVLSLAVLPLERVALTVAPQAASSASSLITAAYLLAGTALLGFRRADFVVRRRGDIVLGMAFGGVSFFLCLLSLLLKLPLDLDWEALQAAPEPPWLEFMLSVLVAPIVEEACYRGVLWRALRTFVPTWTTCVLTSVAFALAHGMLYSRWLDFPDLFLAGLVFAYLRFETRGLWAPIIAHACGNALLLTLSF